MIQTDLVIFWNEIWKAKNAFRLNNRSSRNRLFDNSFDYSIW